MIKTNISTLVPLAFQVSLTRTLGIYTIRVTRVIGMYPYQSTFMTFRIDYLNTSDVVKTLTVDFTQYTDYKTVVASNFSSGLYISIYVVPPYNLNSEITNYLKQRVSISDLSVDNPVYCLFSYYIDSDCVTHIKCIKQNQETILKRIFYNDTLVFFRPNTIYTVWLSYATFYQDENIDICLLPHIVGNGRNKQDVMFWWELTFWWRTTDLEWHSAKRNCYGIPRKVTPRVKKGTTYNGEDGLEIYSYLVRHNNAFQINAEYTGDTGEGPDIAYGNIYGDAENLTRFLGKRGGYVYMTDVQYDAEDAGWFPSEHFINVGSTFVTSYSFDVKLHISKTKIIDNAGDYPENYLEGDLTTFSWNDIAFHSDNKVYTTSQKTFTDIW